MAAGALAAPRPGEADDVVVFDACVSRCTSTDLEAIAMLRQALRSDVPRRDIVVGVREVAARMSDGTPLPPLDDPALTATGLADLLNTAIHAWVAVPVPAPTGAYQEAAKALGDAIATAEANPGLILSTPNLRDLLRRAYIARAVSLWRDHHEDQAADAIAELVRASHDPSIEAEAGPEADHVFQRARAELAARGTGSLEIDVDDPSVQFYIDDGSEARARSYAADVLPGRYRVLAIDPLGRSRRYVVEVRPGTRTSLDIRWARDTQFDASAGDASHPRLGFTYATAAERAQEPALVTYFGSLAHAREAIVVSAWRRAGRAMIAGIRYDVLSGAVIRAGLCPSGDEDLARELATYLVDPSRATPDVERLAVAPWEAPPPAARSPRDRVARPLRVIAWSASASLVVDGIGVTWFERDRGRSATAGYALIGSGLGLALVTAASYLFRSRDPGTVVAVGPDAAGWFATVGWRF